MGIQTITIKTCDRCNTSIHDLSKDHPRGGETTVTWKGWWGGITTQGDEGGVSIQGSALLCHKCGEQFGEWLRRAPANDREGVK